MRQALKRCEHLRDHGIVDTERLDGGDGRGDIERVVTTLELVRVGCPSERHDARFSALGFAKAEGVTFRDDGDVVCGLALEAISLRARVRVEVG
jgi:hypothetical protein